MAYAKRIFFHRKNEDGEQESLCPDCFQRVAWEVLESDLKHGEELHICRLETLDKLWGPRKFIEERNN